MTNLFKPSKNEAQKTKVLISGVVVALTLTLFQNCGKSNQTISASSVESASEQKPAVLELSNDNALTLLASSNDGFGVYAYSVNLNTGDVVRSLYEVPSSDPANVKVQLCLSEEKRSALEKAYNEASVCFYKNDVSSDKQCTQDYKYPYAIVKDSSLNKTYKLGENANACVDFYDICSESRDSFVQAVQSALDGINASSCD